MIEYFMESTHDRVDSLPAFAKRCFASQKKGGGANEYIRDINVVNNIWIISDSSAYLYR